MNNTVENIVVTVDNTEILEILTNIESKLNSFEYIFGVISNSLLYLLVGLVAVLVCYLLYKCVSNFISF